MRIVGVTLVHFNRNLIRLSNSVRNTSEICEFYCTITAYLNDNQITFDKGWYRCICASIILKTSNKKLKDLGINALFVRNQLTV